MEATKHTLKVEIEVLDLNSISALLGEMFSAWTDENHSGHLIKSDGDNCVWYIDTKEIKC